MCGAYTSKNIQLLNKHNNIVLYIVCTGSVIASNKGLRGLELSLNVLDVN